VTGFVWEVVSLHLVHLAMETMHHQLHHYTSELVIGLCPLSADHSLCDTELTPSLLFLLLPFGSYLIHYISAWQQTACTSDPLSGEILWGVHIVTYMGFP
jgi:hypothetical protein